MCVSACESTAAAAAAAAATATDGKLSLILRVLAAAAAVRSPSSLFALSLSVCRFQRALGSHRCAASCKGSGRFVRAAGLGDSASGERTASAGSGPTVVVGQMCRPHSEIQRVEVARPAVPMCASRRPAGVHVRSTCTRCRLARKSPRTFATVCALLAAAAADSRGGGAARHSESAGCSLPAAANATNQPPQHTHTHRSASFRSRRCCKL